MQPVGEGLGRDGRALHALDEHEPHPEEDEQAQDAGEEERLAGRRGAGPWPGGCSGRADGDLLATSVARYNIVVNPLLFGDAGLTDATVMDHAEALSSLLGVPAAELGPMLLGEDGFRYLS
ncbi:MAG: hypothetical protein JWP95_613, partial [Actinotalea sp.]|nr:hypothetical protein [Actinotalea sp.]